MEELRKRFKLNLQNFADPNEGHDEPDPNEGHDEPDPNEGHDEKGDVEKRLESLNTLVESLKAEIESLKKENETLKKDLENLKTEYSKSGDSDGNEAHEEKPKEEVVHTRVDELMSIIMQ